MKETEYIGETGVPITRISRDIAIPTTYLDVYKKQLANKALIKLENELSKR